MALFGALPRSSLWGTDAEVAEDLGIGGLRGFQGLSLSEAAEAAKEGLLVKGRAVEKEAPVLAPTSAEIKGKEEAGCFKPVAVAADAVEEAPAEKKKKRIQLTSHEIEWILAQKAGPMYPPPDKEALLKVCPLETVESIMETSSRIAQAMAVVDEMFLPFQESVRNDFTETGVVMMDAVSEEDSGSEEEFDPMDKEFSASDFGNYSDLYATEEEDDDDDDDGEEEEEVLVALGSASN